MTISLFFIIGGVLFGTVAALVALLNLRLRTNPRLNSIEMEVVNDRIQVSILIAGGFALITLIAVVLGSLTTIPAKNIGVVTTFGKVSSGSLSQGINLVAPWQKVHKIDGTVQTDEYFGDSAILVRTGDGMQTAIWLAIRWEINPDAASVIYQDYRSNDPTEQFRDSVVDTQLKAAVQAVMADYNPIASITAEDGNTDAIELIPDVRELSEAVTQELAANLRTATKSDGTTVELANIISVTISGVNYAKETQAKIDAYNTEVANTRVAAQKERTARAEAKANKALADSISRDPNVLVSKCLDTVDKAMEADYRLPAGYTCWPGGGAAMVVPKGR